MSRVSSFALFLAVALAGAGGVSTAADDTPAQLLEKALYAEQSVGNLDAALRLYEKIVAKHELDADAAAIAQFHIGLAHLKRGERTKAAAAFSRLMEKHPGRKRLITQARNLMPPVVEEALDQIRANYVDDLNDEDELAAAAIRGVLGQLDPHSGFITAEEFENFNINLNRRLVGIGVALRIDEGKLVVTRPIIGAPAYAAGVVAEDTIVSIDGTALDQISEEARLKEAIRLLRGENGTVVTIEVLSPGTDQPKSITIKRDSIKLATVVGDVRDAENKWQFHVSDSPEIGYVRILSFSRETADDFRNVMAQLQEQKLKALIVDLRNVPGGLLSSALEIADMFLKDGLILQSKGRKDQSNTWKADSESILDGVPIAFLVNRRTASAAEILAGSLNDRGRAVVVGEHTFGKGTVQSLIRLRSGSAIKLTTSRFYLPSGASLQKPVNAEPDSEWGVLPSDGLAVEQSEEQLREYDDYRAKLDIAGSRKEGEPQYSDRILAAAVKHLSETLKE